MDNMDWILFEKRILKDHDNKLAEKRILDNLPNFIKFPLKHSKIGIPFANIICNVNYVEIPKFDGFPACVKPETDMMML